MQLHFRYIQRIAKPPRHAHTLKQTTSQKERQVQSGINKHLFSVSRKYDVASCAKNSIKVLNMINLLVRHHCADWKHHQTDTPPKDR